MTRPSKFILAALVALVTGLVVTVAVKDRKQLREAAKIWTLREMAGFAKRADLKGFRMTKNYGKPYYVDGVASVLPFISREFRWTQQIPSKEDWTLESTLAFHWPW